MDAFKALFDWAVPVLDNVPVIQAIAGTILVFFAPGFAWTLVLFKRINYLERLVFSVALSMALVTLSIFGLNAAVNMRINGLNSFLTIVVLIIIPLAVYYTRRYLRKRREKPSVEQERPVTKEEQQL